jgi:hypothetical protein
MFVDMALIENVSREGGEKFSLFLSKMTPKGKITR